MVLATGNANLQQLKSGFGRSLLFLFTAGPPPKIIRERFMSYILRARLRRLLASLRINQHRNSSSRQTSRVRFSTNREIASVETVLPGLVLSHLVATTWHLRPRFLFRVSRRSPLIRRSRTTRTLSKGATMSMSTRAEVRIEPSYSESPTGDIRFCS
jgi:hypothetical protein